MSQKQLGAPQATPEELIGFLSQLELNMTTSTLKSPTPNDVRKIYAAVIPYVLEITMDDIIERNNVIGQRTLLDNSINSTNNTYYNEAVEVLANPELHEQSVIEIEFYKYIQKILIAADYDKFSFKDLIQPSGLRLQKQLSALLNFLRFREEIGIPSYNNIIADTANFEQKKEELEDGLESAMHTLVKLREDSQVIEPEIKLLEQETDDMAKIIKEYDLNRNRYQQEIKKLKTDNTQTGQQLDHDKKQLHTVQAECDKYRSQIVRNPEELKTRIAQLREQVDQAKRQLSQKEAYLSMVNKENENVRKVDKEIQKTIKHLGEYENEKNRNKEMQKNLQNQKKLMEELEDDCQQLVNNKQHLERQIQNVQEKLERLKKQHSQKQDTVSQSIADAKREKQLAMKRVDQVQCKINESQEANTKLKQEAEDIARYHRQEMLLMKQECDKLVAIARNNNQRIYERTPLLDK